MAKVGIINYGIGNVRSVENAIKHTGHEVGSIICSSDFPKFEVVILPGVGAFGKCAEKLIKNELCEGLNQLASGSQKLIGICVGHQLFYEGSDESVNAIGMGFYRGKVQHLSSLPAKQEQKQALQFPNVGYRNVHAMPDNVELPNGLLQERFYFVHSYGAHADEDENCVAYTTYGGRKISAISRNKNIISFQFHPERSREFGLRLLNWAINT